MYKLRILVNNRPIPTFHDREGKIWVEGRYGTRYAIEVKNDGWKRVLSVVSVDGLNVINGKREEPTRAKGYVISPYNNVIIKGWRVSSDNVKEFYFTSRENSYSRKLGADESNIGVIGCVIYEEVPKHQPIVFQQPPTIIKEEHHHHHYREPYYLYNTDWYSGTTTTAATNDILVSNSLNCSQPVQQEFDFDAPVAMAAASSFFMATGSGDKITDRSHTVSFGKKVLAATMSIYYDSRENLIRRGVIRDNYGEELPKPFPNNGNFCPDV